MKLVFLILFFIFPLNIFSQEKFDPQEFLLKNGMKVVVIQNKRAPVIAQMIWYNFGSGVEEKGKSGLAHFMEHLMFKGTKKFLIIIIQSSYQKLVVMKMLLQAMIIQPTIKYIQRLS